MITDDLASFSNITVAGSINRSSGDGLESQWNEMSINKFDSFAYYVYNFRYS